jgi:hypothetical protein
MISPPSGCGRWCRAETAVYSGLACLALTHRLQMIGMSAPSDAVSTYIFAKDGNRPFLTRSVFAEGSEMEFVLKTDSISFPGSAKGLRAIEDILRRFNIDYENIYTFCLSRPVDSDRRHFACHWLVGMSAKSDDRPWVGCGRYDWHFASDQACLVDRLVITIDLMKTLPATDLAATMNWLSGLPYPGARRTMQSKTCPKSKSLPRLKPT